MKLYSLQYQARARAFVETMIQSKDGVPWQAFMSCTLIRYLVRRAGYQFHEERVNGKLLFKAIKPAKGKRDLVLFLAA